MVIGRVLTMDGRLICLLMVIGRVLTVGIPGHQRGSGAVRYVYDIDPSNPFGLVNWHRIYRTCNGRSQSPVDIQTDRVHYVPHRCPRVDFFSRVDHGELENTGLTVKFFARDQDTVRLTRVPNQPGVFYFHDFHVHYGGTRRRNQLFAERAASRLYPGAEHTINRKRFDGEVHMVFFNSRHGTLEEASRHKDGIAVISKFVKIVPDDKLRDNRFTTFLDQNLPLVYAREARFNTTADVSMFLDNNCALYTYHGSLTTPLCNEAVTWVVLRDPIEVAFKTWVKFVFVRSTGGYNRLYGNYRFTTPVRDRVIEANFIQPGIPPRAYQGEIGGGRAGRRRPGPRRRSYPRDIPKTGLSTKRRSKVSNSYPYHTRGRSQRRMSYPKEISQAGRFSRRRTPSRRSSRGTYRDRSLTSSHDQLHVISPSYTPFDFVPSMPDKYSSQYPKLGSINMPKYMNPVAKRVVAKQLRMKDNYLPQYLR